MTLGWAPTGKSFCVSVFLLKRQRGHICSSSFRRIWGLIATIEEIISVPCLIDAGRIKVFIIRNSYIIMSKWSSNDFFQHLMPDSKPWLLILAEFGALRTDFWCSPSLCLKKINILELKIVSKTWSNTVTELTEEPVFLMQLEKSCLFPYISQGKKKKRCTSVAVLKAYLIDEIRNSAYILDPSSNSDLIIFPGLFEIGSEFPR